MKRLNQRESIANSFKSLKKWFEISPMRVTRPLRYCKGRFLLDYMNDIMNLDLNYACKCNPGR